MEKNQTRSERMLDLREQILETARHLFLTEGYKKTTIRQIVDYTGITSGSIYNIFRNKDHIYSVIIDEILSSLLENVRSQYKEESSARRYIAFLAVELYALETNHVVRRMYFEAYRTPVLFEGSVDMHTKFMRAALNDEKGEKYTDEEIRQKVLVMKGSFFSYVISFEFEHKPNARVFRETIAEEIVGILGLTKKDGDELVTFMSDEEQTLREMGNNIINSRIKSTK